MQDLSGYSISIADVQRYRNLKFKGDYPRIRSLLSGMYGLRHAWMSPRRSFSIYWGFINVKTYKESDSGLAHFLAHRSYSPNSLNGVIWGTV